MGLARVGACGLGSSADLLPRMRGCADGRALVVQDGRTVGLVSPTDVMRQLEVAELRRPGQAQHI